MKQWRQGVSMRSAGVQVGSAPPRFSQFHLQHSRDAQVTTSLVLDNRYPTTCFRMCFPSIVLKLNAGAVCQPSLPETLPQHGNPPSSALYMGGVGLHHVKLPSNAVAVEAEGLSGPWGQTWVC